MCRFLALRLKAFFPRAGFLPLEKKGGIIFVVPRFPSKSGLIHKHIVKHIVFFIFGSRSTFLALSFSRQSSALHKHIVNNIRKHIVKTGGFQFYEASH
jgi:hypothetical protein